MNCETCDYCFSDRSANAFECENSEITENELEKYFINAESGCPYYKESEKLF